MGAGEQPAGTRPLRVALLAAFLSDDDVWDLKKLPTDLPDGWAGYPDFPKIEVRNLAALTLGRLLGEKEQPTPKWTVSEWKAFRERMATVAKKIG